LLPVIPLGVHCDDFVFAPGERAAAREALGLTPDTVAVLFAGRLSMSGKAHPYATFRALQTTAEKTGKSLVLVFAGHAFTAAIAEVFETAAAAFCPGVRTVFVDGRDFPAYRGAWAAADLFISLADSIQETFGITPVEAMAAGLPVIVSDWNGYKDTVRDGADGFRITTWAPPPGAGQVIAHDYEIGLSTYEQYLFRSNTAVAVDLGELESRLLALVSDEGLRRRMGASGQARARESFDWSVVFKSYQALWDEQNAIRAKAVADPDMGSWLARAPRAGANHMGPFDTFATYPTHHLAPDTQVSLASDLTPAGYRDLIGQQLLALSPVASVIVDRVLQALAAGPMSVADLTAAIGLAPRQALEVAARLAKIGVVALAAGPDSVSAEDR